MSSYKVIAGVSRVLRQVLWEAYEADPEVFPIVGSEQAIVFKNPTETARDSANRLSLWLYEISENEFLKNQPMVQRNGQRSQFPPLALNFYYLITPFGPSGDANHLLLGKTMQVMYDNAIIVLRDTTEEIFEELRIVLCRLSLEELTRVWEALREPYRLSISYQVRVTKIDSVRLPDHARVIDRIAGFGGTPETE